MALSVLGRGVGPGIEERINDRHVSVHSSVGKGSASLPSGHLRNHVPLASKPLGESGEVRQHPPLDGAGPLLVVHINACLHQQQHALPIRVLFRRHRVQQSGPQIINTVCTGPCFEKCAEDRCGKRADHGCLLKGCHPDNPIHSLERPIWESNQPPLHILSWSQGTAYHESVQSGGCPSSLTLWICSRLEEQVHNAEIRMHHGSHQRSHACENAEVGITSPDNLVRVGTLLQ
mmetsp:Transcript_97269/g.243874  ORF Transcript_97269/g.243874 Transcript_97269/m.243874 type:complete len:232 (+) Transcript_97269:756-1451(+)